MDFFEKMLYRFEISKLFSYTSKVINVIKYLELKSKIIFFKKRLKIEDHTKYRRTIVSLTTIPSRINVVWLSIATIMDQKVKPDKVILWLDKENFSQKGLPENLLDLERLGLEIKFCDNLRSHKKYYYTLKSYPDDVIITTDDDVLYPKTFIKDLLDVHMNYPNDVICYRAHEILLDENGKVKPYNKWNHGSPGYSRSSFFLLPTGVSGVLYPPNSLHEEVLNKKNILKLAPYCDDIWLKIMEIKNNTRARKVKKYSKHFPVIIKTQKRSLTQINVGRNNNDIELSNLLSYYKIDLKTLC
ncbi:hypothetical protein DWY22_10365 [Heyndrickxia coagulans]|uniref:hypothetical protein n=1 Tax=Heyndrickxia coagulans TaxID=1398 RepID=UPI000E4E184E|nr:hypothetical protein [Heyndrickxia coagulans]RGR83289.1 hypothetical protein DWY22_10365 [Heyndrickxia coagulans]